MSDIIVFLGLSFLTLGVWIFMAHISTYFETKQKYIKPEYLKEFTFAKYTSSEIKRYFTGKGLF